MKKYRYYDHGGGGQKRHGCENNRAPGNANQKPVMAVPATMNLASEKRQYNAFQEPPPASGYIIRFTAWAVDIQIVILTSQALEWHK
jgi:hypothetical protein